jgi:outer membrane immunogenic protein
MEFMQKHRALTLLFSIILSSGTAYAADAVSDKALAEDPAFSWTGFYAGVNVGYSAAGDDVVGIHFLKSNYLGDAGKLKNSGYLAGGQIGYNYQINNFVLGIEADFQGSNIGDELDPYRSKINWFGTVRPRVGYAFDRTMIYGTGGLAYGNVKYTVPFDFGGLLTTSSTDTRSGWVIGGGVEHAFTDHLSAKLEYQYINLGTHWVGNDFFSTQATSDFHSARIGLNYKF